MCRLQSEAAALRSEFRYFIRGKLYLPWWKQLLILSTNEIYYG